MRLGEINKKGKTKHLYQSELSDMSMIKNVSEKAKENFKRKPYSGKAGLLKDEREGTKDE